MDWVLYFLGGVVRQHEQDNPVEDLLRIASLMGVVQLFRWSPILILNDAAAYSS